MKPDFGAILNRISSAVSAHRVRADEEIRANRNGTDPARLREYAAQLTRIADDLEKGLA